MERDRREFLAAAAAPPGHDAPGRIGGIAIVNLRGELAMAMRLAGGRSRAEIGRGQVDV